MAKVTSNEYVKVVWVPATYVTDADAIKPTATLLNGPNAVDLSKAIAWQDWAMGASDSDDIEDRGITSPGNEVSRGFANFDGTLSFFRDADIPQTAAGSDYVTAFSTFRTPRTLGWMFVRIAEKKYSDAFAPGDYVSAYKFIADAIVDDAEGAESVKFTVSFLPQGSLQPYAIVADSPASAISGISPTAAMSVGDKAVLQPVLDGKNIGGLATYVSADATIASVSPNGVVTAVGVGGPVNITVSHPSASAPVVQAVTVS